MGRIAHHYEEEQPRNANLVSLFNTNEKGQYPIVFSVWKKKHMTQSRILL
jgi:hypothetical protein